MTRHTLTPRVERYSWGALIALDAGPFFCVVLHTDHQTALRKLLDGEAERVSFREETGRVWDVTLDRLATEVLFDRRDGQAKGIVTPAALRQALKEAA